MSTKPRKLNSNDPRGARQRNRILAAIATEPLTAQQLADKLHLSRDGINIHLKLMKNASPRMVHVSGWLQCPKGGRPAPQYRPGDKPDAAYVTTRTPTRHLKIGQNFAIIKRELRCKSMTTAQLGEVLGITSNWARHFVAQLRAEKKVYIAGWKHLPAGIAPLYTLGNREDVPKPPCDKASAYQRLKEKRKSDPAAQERYERDLKRRRIQSRIVKLRNNPQTWFGVLPGAQGVQARETA